VSVDNRPTVSPIPLVCHVNVQAKLSSILIRRLLQNKAKFHELSEGSNVG